MYITFHRDVTYHMRLRYTNLHSIMKKKKKTPVCVYLSGYTKNTI